VTASLTSAAATLWHALAVTITRTTTGPHGDASATYSDDERYRYRLSRRWDDRPMAAFLMLNPSTATEQALDPTLRRCLGFARREGAGGFIVVNLFALRATDPKVMLADPCPEGEGFVNDHITGEVADEAAYVIAAWGTDGKHRGRDKIVMRNLAESGADVYRLGPPTKDGHPRHPLYLKGDLPLVRHL
jgi:hypothetical protein